MTTRRRPPDQAVRNRIEREFDRNLLVEAGAGSGKTESLARRMAAGIASGVFEVERMAAVTFTRKAAAELRGRFQQALEARLLGAPDREKSGAVPAPDAEQRRRLEHALRHIERLFAGTIHAFCAHLLRERPVESGIAPGFIELDEVEDERHRERAWRDFVTRARAGTRSARRPAGVRAIFELRDAGIRPAHLDGALRLMCEHEDVEFPAGTATMPDAAAGWEALDRFWRALSALAPAQPDPDAKCQALRLALEFGPRYDYARRRGRASDLADLLRSWKTVKLTKKWWPGHGAEAKDLLLAFQADTAVPWHDRWLEHVYRLAVVVLADARAFYADERRRANLVNYVDLLMVTARLLRENPTVRRALQRKYRHLFVDEFQDTDPIQAEIFTLLAADEARPERSSGGSAPALDWTRVPLRAGALFVVGDPKQSIYRFRRAEIDIYNRVRDRILACGGDVLALTANFRSVPGLCRLANDVFVGRFPSEPTQHSPRFEALQPMRDECAAGGGPAVARLTIPSAIQTAEVPAAEAAMIAAYIEGEVSAGRRRYGDFLVLTRQRPRLGVYADALDTRQIPVEVSGAGRFGGSAEVMALALLLRALADPLDGPSIVGVLRGPLFGISDPELFRYRQAGGRFDLAVPPPRADDGEANAALEAAYGPALPALHALHRYRHLARTLPMPVALDLVLEQTGWLALAATTSGGAKGGALLQAIDRVREVAELGGGPAEAADALDADAANPEKAPGEVDVLPLEPGRRDVVRLMNLHKAKGLEAPVVILADPTHGYRFGTSLRIMRDGGTARGYMTIVHRRDGSFSDTLLASPAGWEGHRAAEDEYRDAEIDRLIYVAATRARDLLVVSRHDGASGRDRNEAWAILEPVLGDAPELTIEPASAAAEPPMPALTGPAREKAGADREADHARARRPSWDVTSVTTAVPLRLRARRVREVMDAGAAAGAIADETPSHRADAGVAWGSLVHGLLEHAMRRRGTTRADLERLGRWLIVDEPELRPALAQAVEVVQAVEKAGLWAAAQASGRDHAEVPFAVLDARPGLPPTVVRGVMDLVYDDGTGWHVVDYKTDVDATDARELVHRHVDQLTAYARAWVQATGQRSPRAGIFGVRAMQIAWLPADDKL